MFSNQEFSPKYWVVHDKTTDDVFIDTASKSQGDAISTYLITHCMYAEDNINVKDIDHEDIECILIEINCLTQ